jgi:hypothetical protein
MRNFLAFRGGITPKLVIGLAAAVVFLVGGAVWLMMGPIEYAAPSDSADRPVEADPEQQLEALDVTAPTLDFSVSPLGDTGVSDFNLGADVPKVGFGNVAVDDDFGYSGDVSLTVPRVNVTAPTEFNVAATTPPPTPTPPPAADPPSGNGGGAPTVSAGTCAQFSAVPSCSYVPDPNGAALCEQCKAAGY